MNFTHLSVVSLLAIILTILCSCGQKSTPINFENESETTIQIDGSDYSVRSVYKGKTWGLFGKRKYDFNLLDASGNPVSASFEFTNDENLVKSKTIYESTWNEGTGLWVNNATYQYNTGLADVTIIKDEPSGSTTPYRYKAKVKNETEEKKEYFQLIIEIYDPGTQERKKKKKKPHKVEDPDNTFLPSPK